jgi:hypothetical protein
MKTFLLGGLFGLLFSIIAIWFLKLSPWAPLPELKLKVFLIGGCLLGGCINLMMGNYENTLFGKSRDLSS